MIRRIYFDHNATSPMSMEVARKIAVLGNLGNPASIHAEGRAARSLLDQARARVAAWCGLSPDCVVFTSGGTEANALAIHVWKRRAECEGRARIIDMDRSSHASVRENVERGGKSAIGNPNKGDLNTGPPGDGWILSKGDEKASLHLAIAAHNETGHISDMDRVIVQAQEEKAYLHVDAVQWPGKLPFHPKLREADSFSISGHKIGGPMGAGALIIPKPMEIEPMVRGGGQEAGRRSGTPPLAAIVGLGEAIVLNCDADNLRNLAMKLRDGILKRIRDQATELSDCEHGLPGTLLVAFHGIPGDVFVAALDTAGIAASYGAACSSGEHEPSPALLGAGISYDDAGSAIRFSMGHGNTIAEIDDAVDRISRVHAQVNAALLDTQKANKS